MYNLIANKIISNKITFSNNFVLFNNSIGDQ